MQLKKSISFCKDISIQIPLPSASAEYSSKTNSLQEEQQFKSHTRFEARRSSTMSSKAK